MDRCAAFCSSRIRRSRYFCRPAAKREFVALPCLDDDAEEGAAYLDIGDLGDLWGTVP
jgi:hypothetical protein